MDSAMEDIWRRYDPKTLHVAMENGNDPGAGAFQGWPGVRTVRKSGEGYDLLLDGSGDSADLMRRAAELRPRKVELARASLEEIFITLSGGDAAVLEAEKEHPVVAGAVRP